VCEIKRSLAIVIGINIYKNIRQLKNAVSDAVRLASILKDIYGYEVLLLLNQRATKAELDRLVESLKKRIIQFDRQQIQVKGSDRVLFYFAGHGFAKNAQDSEDSEDSKPAKPAGYFMPQDAEDNNENTWLSMHEVYEAFSNLGCHHLLMILDCCFADRISWVGQGRNAVRSRQVYRQSYDRFIKYRTEQIITSAAYDEEAQDSSRFGKRGEKNGNSPFAYLLLKVLDVLDNTDEVKDKAIEAMVEDKIITVHELFAYLQNKLGEIAQGQTPGLSQPRKYDREIRDYVYLKGEYIFPLPQFNPEKLEKFKLDKNSNPYKGLASFENKKGDRELFFGRQTLSQKLAKEVTEKPLTIVLGVSGSGKSSLVKAGLIPALEAPTTQQQWCIPDPMRPGESPFKALNKILTQSSSGSSIISLKSEEQVKIINRKIGDLISRNFESKLLLVIDQTEELFTLCRDEQKRENFLSLLAELSNKYPQLRIVLTLRSDFEPQLRNVIKDNCWQQTWQDGRFFVTPMNREELQQAIEEPAAQRTLFFESPKLVNQLIDEVIQMPGALPLLSFTLSELYLKYLKAEENHERDDRTITEADYKELGGVARSLTQTADRTYKKLVEKEKIDSSIIRNVMLRMLSLNSGELARRRVPTSELVYPQSINEQVEKVRYCFIEARLLTTGLDVENQEYIEPVHDVLITGWPQIKYWLDEKQAIVKQKSGWNPIKNLSNSIKVPLSLTSKENGSKNDSKETEKQLKVNLPLQRDVSTAALKWGENNKETKYLWNASPYLDVLELVLKSNENWFNQLEAEFVRQSVWQRRRNTNLRWSIAIGVMLLSGGLTIWALRGQRQALIEQMSADNNSTQTLLRTNQLTLDALISSLRAAKPLNDWLFWGPLQPDKQLQSQVTGTLQIATYAVREQNRWQLPQNWIAEDIVSQNQKILVAVRDVANRDNNVCIWSTKSQPDKPLLCQKFLHNQNTLKKVKFSPDGKKIVIISTSQQDTAYYCWDLEHNQINTLSGSIFTDIFSFYPDSKKLALTDGHTVYLWDWKNQQLRPSSSKGLQGNIRGINFKPDGSLLVATSSEGQDFTAIHVLDYSSGEKKEYKFPRRLDILNATISSNGKQLAITHIEQFGLRGFASTLLWKSQNEEPQDLGFDSSPTERLSFSPNGEQAVITSSDSTIRLVNSGSSKDQVIQGHQSIFRSVNFTPDSKQLLTASNDGTLSLWNLKQKLVSARTPALELPGLFHRFALSPDGKQLVALKVDTIEAGTIHLWDLSSNQELKLPSLLQQRRYDKESQLVLSSNDKQSAQLAILGRSIIHLWDLSLGEEHVYNTSFNSIDPRGQLGIFSSDGKQLAIAEGSSIYQQNLVNRKESEKFNCRNHIAALTWKTDGKLVAATIDNTTATTNLDIWDFSSDSSCKKQLASLQPEEDFMKHLRRGSMHGPSFAGFKFNTDSNIINILFGNHIILWNWQSNLLVKLDIDENVDEKDFQSSPYGSYGNFYNDRISSDGNTLVTMRNGKIKLWKLGGLDTIMQRDCEQVHDYLATLDEKNSDRHLCDDVPKVVVKDKSF
jgi:WD40 repeat protein